ncbi:restriction endonuclease subunit S [Latilactobacillus curvatus]|uniref:restriction endonuclease subunit S n=1 Tax=Latilactobacillus curvatus TaxID=28038 RepID=UPI00240FA692|nr:restriction endonuclease subunit S [Latilactobacillus curvatus]MDG2977768.1 restriction endonuclease subunit S [Latilactobacillus curvatus]
MKEQKKQPELRFKGFTDDWEQRKLGDEVLIVMGQSPNSENYTDNPNDHILVQGNADMKNGYVFPRVWTTQVTKQAEKNDLILSVRAPVGDIGKTDYDVVIGRGVAAIKGNEFIFQNLGKMKSNGYWTRYSTGSTFESINSSDTKEAIISIPRIKEQQKIGSFFKQLDKTIALHQRKLELLKKLKRGYLQQMFPVKDHIIPKLRFSGFSGNWKQRKLGEEAEILAGGDIDKNKLRKFGKYPVFANALTDDGIVGYYNDYFRIKAPAVTVTGRGAVGHAQARKINFTPVVRLLSVKSKHNVAFLENTINNHKVLVESTGVPQLTSPQLGNYKILFPTIEEEMKIGIFLSQLDNVINAYQSKIENTKSLKQAYLQKLFP